MDDSTAETAEKSGSGTRAQILFQALVLGLLLILLINYKGSAGLNKVRQGRAIGSSHLPAWQVSNNATTLSNTLGYLKIIWPALVFGVLISAAARTSLSRTRLHAMFSGAAVRDQFVAALSGAPLMLCSCCVAPIFPSVYQRTRKLAPVLALTLASPSLNPAALALSFILFPYRVAGARLAMALLLVLLGSVAVARMAHGPVPDLEADSGTEGGTWAKLLSSSGRSLMYVLLRTVPLILIGVWASMWIVHHLPSQQSMRPGVHVPAIMGIALFSVLLTLPSLFEIPLALSIMAAGGPIGGALAVLFAGPAINLPSLFIIGRYSTWKVGCCGGFTRVGHGRGRGTIAGLNRSFCGNRPYASLLSTE